MNPVVLYRKGVDYDSDKEELAAIEKAGMVTIHQRTDVMDGDLVVGRMSVLPFYRELSIDVENRGGRLINTFRQHQFIADMREWCQVLGDMTPHLYERLQDIPDVGPFVLKGQTNSKKHLWNTHMFAADKKVAGEVWSRLRDDMLLADQEIYARDYVPLVKLAEGFNGLPITLEFRFFICRKQIVSGGFYWASHTDDLPQGIPVWEQLVPTDFLNDAIERIGDHAEFYALDIARTEAGPWIVVEINDAQMSGLSCNDPALFYSNLQRILTT